MRPMSIRFVVPIALLLSSTSAFAQSGPWTVSEVKGSVTVEDSQGKRQAKRGTKVAAGGSIEVGPKGKAVVVRDREFVTVKANSRIRFPEEEQSRSIMQVLQDWGTAVFNIGKQENPHFGVETPYLAAVVKGTTFTITVTEDGASMQVTEGAVEVQTLDGEAHDLVLPGAVAIVAADDRYRLTVEGAERKIIDSPNRPVQGAQAAPSPAVARVSGSGRPVLSQTSQAITSGIIAGGDDFGAMSNGLITGNNASGMASFAANLSEQDRRGDVANNVPTDDILGRSLFRSDGPVIIAAAPDESGAPADLIIVADLAGGEGAPEPAPLAVVAPEPEPAPAPVVVPEPEPEAVVAPEPEPEPVVAPEPEPEPVVAPQPEPEAVVAPEPEPEAVVAPEPEPEAVVAPEPEPEAVVAPEPEPEPVVAPEPEPEPEEEEDDGGFCIGSICFDGNGILDDDEIEALEDKFEELVEDAEEDLEEFQNGNGNGNGNNGNNNGDTGENDNNDDDNNGSDDNNGNDDSNGNNGNNGVGND